MHTCYNLVPPSNALDTKIYSGKFNEYFSLCLYAHEKSEAKSKMHYRAYLHLKRLKGDPDNKAIYYLCN